MYLTYGSYSWDANEAQLVGIDKRVEHNARGYRERVIEKWTVRGIKQAASQAALTTALAAMEAALSQDGLALTFYLDDAATATVHAIAASTLFGVRVKGLRYPSGDGAEYSTFRTWEADFEAEAIASGSNSILVSFQETLSFQGGGPRFVFLQTITGQPQKQLVAQSTPYRVVQSGSASQLGSYPAVPGPLWPDAEHLEERRISRRGPELGKGFTGEAGVNWSFSFESAVPLNGFPTIR